MFFIGTTGSLWFYSKDEATNFNAGILFKDNANNFKYFECNAKLLPNTVAQFISVNINGILKDRTIAVSLKYLRNFWRSREMPLINYKVELKFKWTKYCILAAAGNYNTDANPNNFIFTIKDAKLYVPVLT